MTAPVGVPCIADVTVTARGRVRHLCPHVDESDDGTVEITWVCVGATVELHSLAAYLARYAESRISHEDLTDQIRRDLAALPGIANVTVTACYVTAGLDVEVTSAVSGHAVRTGGA